MISKADKALLLSKISTLENRLMDAIEEQKKLAKSIMKLMDKKAYQTEWLTIEETVELTGLSKESLYQETHKRSFTTRERGLRRFNRASVIEWMGEKKSKSELVNDHKLKRA